MRIFNLVPLVLVIYALLSPYPASAQSDSVLNTGISGVVNHTSAIAVYQFFNASWDSEKSHKGEYEILKPFIKTDSGWIKNTVYYGKEIFYLVNIGKPVRKIEGYRY